MGYQGHRRRQPLPQEVLRLFYDRDGWIVTEEKPTPAELKSLHKLIGKEKADIEAFSFNTTISAFMIALNELSALKCNRFLPGTDQQPKRRIYGFRHAFLFDPVITEGDAPSEYIL